MADPFTATASAIGSGLGALSTYNAGQAAKAEAKQSAKLEGIRANEEAIERRERLIQALAHQNARVGASGVSGMTPTQVKLEDISEFEREDETKRAISRWRQSSIKTAGTNAARAATLQAGASLFQGGADAYQAFGN